MATVIEPQLGQNGEHLKWELAKIPSNKPFLNITTSAYEPLSSSDNMNFIKTKSLVYTPFHTNARYVHFEIGYSRESKWLTHLSDKWNEYANFFVAGFFEAIYSTNEGNSTLTYIQLDAKLIDYDIRFRTSQQSDPKSPKSPITNAFAQRRSKFSSNDSPTASASKSVTSETAPTTIKKESDNHKDIIMVDSDLDLQVASKKRTLSDLCIDSGEEIDDKVDETKETKGGRGRGGRGKRGRGRK